MVQADHVLIKNCNVEQENWEIKSIKIAKQ